MSATSRPHGGGAAAPLLPPVARRGRSSVAAMGGAEPGGPGRAPAPAHQPPGLNGAFLLATYAHCPAGLLLLDPASRIVHLNLEIERLFGYAPGDLLGRPVAMLMPGGLGPGLSRGTIDLAVATSRGPIGADSGPDIPGRHRDGRRIPVAIDLTPLPTAKGLGTLVVITDLTERRQSEARRRGPQKLEALAILARGLARDLDPIWSQTAKCAEDALANLASLPLAAVDLRGILDGVGRGRRALARLLVLSRQEPPERTPTEVASSVRKAIGGLRAEDLRGIVIRTHVSPGTPSVNAEASELVEIVLSLVDNAIAAMRGRGGALEIYLAPAMVDRLFLADHPGMFQGAHAHLTVTDTGTGIQPQDLGRTFEPFFTTRPDGEALGLGLTVAERTVESLAGTIEVRSRPGHGTRFDVYLPATTVDLSQRRR